MIDTLKGSESLSVFESRMKAIAAKIFAKYNPEKGNLFSFDAPIENGYLGKNFSMMVESGNPEDKLVVIVGRDWNGAETRHTVITIGQYEESRFLPKITTRARQIEIDLLGQSYNSDSHDIIRLDWKKDGSIVLGPDNIATDRAQELLQMAENMIQGEDLILHFSKLENDGALRS